MTTPAMMGKNMGRPRARAIVAAARHILEEEGRDALTMRRLASAVGMRAPSLYKHFPDKAAVEVALIECGFAEWTASFEAALTRQGESLAALAEAYRAFSRQHPHLYRLMTAVPDPSLRYTLRPRSSAITRTAPPRCWKRRTLMRPVVMTWPVAIEVTRPIETNT